LAYSGGICPILRRNNPNKVDVDPIVYVPFRQDRASAAPRLSPARCLREFGDHRFPQEVRGIDEDPRYSL